MKNVYIKEIAEIVPFALLITHEITDHRYRPYGELRVLYGVPRWVNDKIMKTCEDGIVTCIFEEGSALFYTATASDKLIELETRRIGNQPTANKRECNIQKNFHVTIRK